MSVTQLDPLNVDGVAFVLLLLVLPVVSVGATSGSATLWGFGLLLLVVGGFLSILTHFVIKD
ncbi:MAG: hypothetical protein ABEJ81_06980 [Haloferacaceae archaeon]